MPYDHGPLQTYEVIYASGHVSRVRAHQVLWPQRNMLFGDVLTSTARPEFVLIHGQFGEHWRLVLSARVEDVLSVRLMDEAELTTGGA